jgi:hypothetical protein
VALKRKKSNDAGWAQLQYLRRASGAGIGFQRAAESGGLLDAARVADFEKRETMVATGMNAPDGTQGDRRIASPGRERLRLWNRLVHFIRRPARVNPHRPLYQSRKTSSLRWIQSSFHANSVNRCQTRSVLKNRSTFPLNWHDRFRPLSMIGL